MNRPSSGPRTRSDRAGGSLRRRGRDDHALPDLLPPFDGAGPKRFQGWFNCFLRDR
jgi:hypothetical protein